MPHHPFKILFLSACLAICALAQPKPTLTPADYGKWETLGAGTVSPDGKWLACEIRRSNGDNELRVAATAGGGKVHGLANCTGAAFSSDSRWLGCEAGLSETEQERARKASRTVQNKLSLLDLSSGNNTLIDDVQALAFAGDGPYLAFRKYNPAPAGAGAGRGGNAPAPAPAGGGRGGRGGAAEPSDAERDPIGSVLIVRNLTTGLDTTFGNVTNYAWQDKGTNLAMTIGVEGRTGNEIQVFDPKSGSLKVLDSGPALFTALTWRKESSDLAALRSLKQDGYEGESYSLLAWTSLA